MIVDKDIDLDDRNWGRDSDRGRDRDRFIVGGI